MEAPILEPPRRILLAVDEAGSATTAADEAIRMASEGHGGLVVLSVVEPGKLRLTGGRTRRVDQERDRLAVGAQSIVRRAREVGVAAAYLVWQGDPAEAILEAAVAESADVIVLGSRPRTNIRKLILGSVSAEVARRASCEVVIVPK